MTKRRLLVGLAAAILAGAAVLAGLLLGAFDTTVVSKTTATPLPANEMKRLAERGTYVAKVADCYACHTAKGGAPWAGGMPFETPFGTIYATNISPDKDFGIGRWTREEFHRAVRDGVGKGETHLYPAMPYTSYRQMLPEDVDAIFAYLMTREPMRVENSRNKLPFPFNIRSSLAFWNLVNLRRDGFKSDPVRSEIWNRGRYIVDALAHCGECHTPRNVMEAMKQTDYLKGAVMERIEAPDITTAGLRHMGFDPPTLARFMKTGLSAQGSMTNQMFEVVHFSTQYMRDEDLKAMAAYLFDLDSMPQTESVARALAPAEMSEAVADTARATYGNLCSGCHGSGGQGMPHVAVPLSTNASLRLASPRNLIQAVLHGIPAQQFPGLERMEPMPAFADLLDDQAIADLANWMRAHWGGQPPRVTAADIAKLR